MKINSSKAITVGDNIDTDLIIAARYLNSSDPEHLAKYVFEDLDSTLKDKINSSTCIVAGENFGCGSSREHAPIAIKAANASCVIAKSFARIFYRNAFNMGLYIFELDEVDEISEDDIIEVDINKGAINNITTNKQYSFKPIPPFMQELIKMGGLMQYAKTKIANKA